MICEGFTEEDLEYMREDMMLECRRNCQYQVDALIMADWRFETNREDSEPWQWYWRRPPRTRHRKGRFYCSTNQAYNALMRELDK